MRKDYYTALVVIALLVILALTSHVGPVNASGIQAFATVPAGGTGRNTLTAHNVLLGAGTSPVNLAAPGTAGLPLCSNGASADPSFETCSGAVNQLHSITFVLDGGGSVIATGAVNKFPPVDYACTINRVDVTGNPSGSITVDIWKAAGAIPTSMNKISASAPATLSSSQINLNGSLTGWTTSVSIGDVFGASVATSTTVTSATIVMWCQ